MFENVAVLLDDPLIQKYQYVQYANLFDEIDPAWFEGCTTIGVTAGASTPETQIKAVIDFLKKL